MILWCNITLIYGIITLKTFVTLTMVWLFAEGCQCLNTINILQIALSLQNIFDIFG